MKTAAFIPACALMLSGAAVTLADDEHPLTASWKAVELAGKPVDGPTLDYADDKISGTGGCNRFTGPVTIEDDGVQIGPLAGTRMMCEGKMEIEAAYYAALEAARSFTVEDDTLVLKGEDRKVLIKFKK